MKKCPFCAEEIQDAAIKCRFCGEFFQRQTVSQPASNPVPSTPSAPQEVLSVQKTTDGFSVTGMILGIVSVFLYRPFSIFPVLAIVFGSIGLSRTSKSIRSGRGMAWAGLVLGIVFSLMALFYHPESKGSDNRYGYAEQTENIKRLLPEFTQNWNWQTWLGASAIALIIIGMTYINIRDSKDNKEKQE